MPIGLSHHAANVREYYGTRLHTEQMSLIEDIIAKLRANPNLVSDEEIRKQLARVSEIEEIFDKGGLDQLVDADLRTLTTLERIEIVFKRFWPIFITVMVGLISAGIGGLLYAFLKENLPSLGYFFIPPAHAATSTQESIVDRSQLSIILIAGGFVFLMLNCIFWSVVLVLTTKAKTFELAARMVTGTFTFLTGVLTGWFGRGGA